LFVQGDGDREVTVLFPPSRTLEHFLRYDEQFFSIFPYDAVFLRSLDFILVSVQQFPGTLLVKRIRSLYTLGSLSPILDLVGHNPFALLAEILNARLVTSAALYAAVVEQECAAKVVRKLFVVFLTALGANLPAAQAQSVVSSNESRIEL